MNNSMEHKKTVIIDKITSMSHDYKNVKNTKKKKIDGLCKYSISALSFFLLFSAFIILNRGLSLISRKSRL